MLCVYLQTLKLHFSGRRRRRSTRWPQLEERVAEWESELRQDGYIVTQNKIRAYALRWAKAHKIKDFRATSGWCSRFMNRKNLVIQQKLQSDHSHKVANFHRSSIRMKKINQYPLHCIGNMDETPLNFDIMADRTVDIKGAKTFKFSGTSHEKTKFTVL